jgi:hypothetical protein
MNHHCLQLFVDVSSSDGGMTMAKKETSASKANTATKTATGRKRHTEDSEYESGIESTTTAIHIPKTTWNLLRSVAFHRAQLNGGRVSVSKLITQLVERHRPELEKEVAQPVS